MDHNYRTKLYTHIHTHNVYTLNFLHQCIYRSFFSWYAVVDGQFIDQWSIHWTHAYCQISSSSLNCEILWVALNFCLLLEFFFYNNNNNEPINKTKQKKQNEIFGLHLFFFRKYLINFSCECQKTTSNQNKMRREREREMTRCLFHPKFYFFLRVCVCVYFDSIRLFISFSFHSFTVVELPGSFFI